MPLTITHLRAPVPPRIRVEEHPSRFRTPAPGQRRLWTEDMDTRLAELWKAGKPSREIAVELGNMTGCAVIGRAHRLGLPKRVNPVRPPSAQQEHAVRAARLFPILRGYAERGEPCPFNSQLAARLDCSPTSIVAAMHFLESNGMIRVERGNNRRVVTICATGHKTAGEVKKPHWRAAA